jgi:hypothetical protein
MAIRVTVSNANDFAFWRPEDLNLGDVLGDCNGGITQLFLIVEVSRDGERRYIDLLMPDGIETVSNCTFNISRKLYRVTDLTLEVVQ